MAKQVPFIAFIRVVPHRGSGKRFEYIRDLEKVASRVHDKLMEDADLNIANRMGGYSKAATGVAIKPQIGQFPAQLTVAGFYLSDESTVVPYPEKSLISGGEHLTGVSSGHGWVADPTDTADSLVTTLHSKLSSAMTDVLGNSDWNIYRIDVAGVVYGDRGLHFPRPTGGNQAT